MHRHLLLICVLFLTSIVLTGCSTSNHGNNPNYERQNDSNRKSTKVHAPSNIRAIKDIPQFEETDKIIAPGFLFALSHPTDEKLKGTFRVQLDGLLALPYGVRITVTDLTYQELREKVLSSYNSFFQRGAQNVSFALLRKEYWVEIRGFVKNPGTYLVKRKESIDKIIDMAGGLAGNIKQDFFMASVKQQNLSYSVSLNQYYENNVLGISFVWTGGDTIFINLSNEDATTQVAPTVEVLGGVMKPGKTFFREDANVFYYLSKRGGVIPNVGYEEAFVIRKGPNGLERINFNITNMDTIPLIKPGDTIMLNGERKTAWDRVWERTTQVASILTTIAFFIIAF
jgi:protein involved in polysaccharide export with SLBB domain